MKNQSDPAQVKWELFLSIALIVAIYLGRDYIAAFFRNMPVAFPH